MKLNDVDIKNITNLLKIFTENPKKTISFLGIIIVLSILNFIYPTIRFTHTILNSLFVFIMLLVPYAMLILSFYLKSILKKILLVVNSLISINFSFILLFYLFFSLPFLLGEANPRLEKEVNLQSSKVRCYSFNGGATTAFQFYFYQEFEIIPFIAIVKEINVRDTNSLIIKKIDSNSVNINGEIFKLDRYLYFK